MKTVNPIVEYLKELLASGKTTKEKICVACDLKYPTFENTFDRPTVSILVRKSLRYGGVVPERVFAAYDIWASEHKKEKKHGNSKATTRNKNKSESKDSGTKDASY